MLENRNDSVGQISEELRINKEFDFLKESYSDIHEEYNYDLCEDYFNSQIDEAKTVTFAGKTYPKGGWALILSGGSGSGKGFIRSHKIAIDAKVLDVDELKTLYMKAAKSGKIKDEKNGNYDMQNPDDVGTLHQIVKSKDYKNKREDAFFAANANKKGEDKPNVIYDITGDDPKKLASISKKMKEMGYKVALVWVVTNREEAYIRNMKRDRVVPQKVFHSTHNDVKKAVNQFIRSVDAKYCDEAWIAFGSGNSARELTKEQQKELDKMGVVKLEKNGSVFDVPQSVEDRVEDILGPDEPNPDKPENYISYDEFGNVSTGEVNGMGLGELKDVVKSLGFEDSYKKDLLKSDSEDELISAIKTMPEEKIKKAIQMARAREGKLSIRKDRK